MNPQYPVIDIHAHTYASAAMGLQAQAGQGRGRCFGQAEELLSIMDTAGIKMACQVNMTPVASMRLAALEQLGRAPSGEEERALAEKLAGRLKRRNDWTMARAAENPRLAAFPSLDPIMGAHGMLEELARLMAAPHPPSGIKLHPGEGRYYPDDARLAPVYAELARLGLGVISHAGIFTTDKDYTHPDAFGPVARAFPSLTLVLAHLGAAFFSEAERLAQTHQNVFFDTSATLHGEGGHQWLDDAQALALIRSLGAHRVMFGSDFPWFHPGRALKRLQGLGLTRQELELITHENAQRVLGLAAG